MGVKVICIVVGQNAFFKTCSTCFQNLFSTMHFQKQKHIQHILKTHIEQGYWVYGAPYGVSVTLEKIMHMG